MYTMSMDRLLTTPGIARKAGVRNQTVRMWRMKHQDFPQAVRWYGNTPVYRREEVLEWLRRHNKGYEGEDECDE